MKKKIMQINVTCGNGSTGKLAMALYKASILDGYDGRFAYAEMEPMLESAFRIETKAQNVIRRAKNRFFGRKQKHSAPGTARLLRYIEEEKPALIHLHNIHHNILHYPTLFAFLVEKNIPAVFTLHDCWGFTGWCYHYMSRKCEGYKTGCKNCLRKEARDDIVTTPGAAWNTKKTLLGGNDNIYPVCVSNWLRDSAALSYMGNMMHKPQTIYNGINTTLFSPRKSNIRQTLGIREDDFLILSVASYWNDNKGLSLFKELSYMVPEDAVIVLVGQGLDTVNERNIRCIPQTANQEQLAQLYSAADVFINGSMEETFGLTTAEALACGTPAIVFNSTACPEIVDEKTGIVVECDVLQMAAAIEQIKSCGKALYSENCVSRVRKMFDENQMTKNYLRLYRRILHDEQGESASI